MDEEKKYVLSVIRMDFFENPAIYFDEKAPQPNSHQPPRASSPYFSAQLIL